MTGGNCRRDWRPWWRTGGYPISWRPSPSEGFDEQGRPIDVSRIFALHAELADGSTTTFRALQQFDNAEQAAAAAAWLNEQDEPRWRSIGWGSSATIDEWRHRGATVYGEVVLPDEELPGLVQGN